MFGIPIQMRGGVKFSPGAEGLAGPGTLIWLPWLFTKVNILANADNHSLWTGAAGLTASQTDRFGGSTAEKWIEHSGVAAGRSLTSASIASGAVRLLCLLAFKQVAGSAADRRLGITVRTATTGTNGAYIIVDEIGTNTDSAAFGSWTLHSASVTAVDNGYYMASIDFTTTDANVEVFLRQRDDSGITYNGDGASGWYIDDNSISKI